MYPDPFAEVVGMLVTEAHLAISTDCIKSTFGAVGTGPIRVKGKSLCTWFHKFCEVAVEFAFLVECFSAITAHELLWKTLLWRAL
jgi:hypothetical protein